MTPIATNEVGASVDDQWGWELVSSIALVVIYLLHNIVVLLPPLESLNLFKEVGAKGRTLEVEEGAKCLGHPLLPASTSLQS